MNDFARSAYRRRCGFVLLLISALAGACVSKKEAAEARASVYDADFAVVYSAVVEAVRELYPNFDDDPSAGVVKTAWHQVKYSDPGADDPKSVQSRDRTAGVGASSPGNGLAYNPSLARRTNFIRFDVTVAGGRPWRVRVVGKASELEPGNALPTEMRGGNTPHWLGGRTDALVIAIHRRLKAYAKKAPNVVVDVEPDDEKAIEVKGDVPDGARAAAVAVLAALNQRDYTALRANVADDVVWSLGAAPGADAALVMWQADPGVFTAMQQAITAGCAKDGTEVVCPAGAPAEDLAGAPASRWVARFGERGGGWKLISFVAAE